MSNDVLHMEAGREMDALVYTTVFGGLAFRSEGHWDFTGERDYLDDGDVYYLGDHGVIIRIPRYSSDMTAAWSIAEKLGLAMLNKVHARWEAYFPDNKHADSNTAPLAICRAALLCMLST